MKVAIIGTGNVGTSLAHGFSATGHKVWLASRDPKSEKVQALAAATNAVAADYEEAVKAAEIIVLAVHWSALSGVLAKLAALPYAEKLLIDATNPLDFSGGRPKLALGFSDSAGETVQRALPSARVVKAFNTVGAGLMVQPKWTGNPQSMWIAGDDAEGKLQVSAILKAFGWAGALDAGAITASRLLEPLAMLWIDYGIDRDHWTHAHALVETQVA